MRNGFVTGGTVTNATNVGMPIVLNHFSVKAIDVDAKDL